ncbi:DsbC family protein [uncultured Cardiobacterium sp.]|uniref:DsbC family protein n=1 Tax=uncultured Cardiobacterium sp. TaxID=417619 RepID=UPI00262BE80D|nr:DsbC family protein [uncultured Cardiobacterium sp.]
MRTLLCLLAAVWITAAHAASPNMELAKSVFDPRVMSNAVESPIPGLYQFAQGNEVFYISADGRYVMQGEMIDLQTQINVTETFRAGERVKTLAALDPQTMISVLPNAPAYHITVFTDVDCPYCRVMQQNILEYTQRGIAIHYLAYPRSGPNGVAARRMAQVWCSSDRLSALLLAQTDQPLPNSRGDCTGLIREQYALAQKLGVSSTPSIILEDGTLIPGFVAPANLETILNKHPDQILIEKSSDEEAVRLAAPPPPPPPVAR